MEYSYLLPRLTVLATLMSLLVTRTTQTNLLFSGDSLLTNDHLYDGQHNFIMQEDCNLVLYGGNWQSNTATNGRQCQLSLLNNGRLVIYSDNGNGQLVWSSEAAGSSIGEYVAVLHPQGKVVVYGPSIWKTMPHAVALEETGRRNSETAAGAGDVNNIQRVANVLFAGQVLYGDGHLKSGIVELVMQGDCNLVLYNGGWQSNTAGNGAYCFARLDHHGGLYVMDDVYNTIWSNGVNSEEGDYIAALKDGHFVVYGPAIWSTKNGALVDSSRSASTGIAAV